MLISVCKLSYLCTETKNISRVKCEFQLVLYFTLKWSTEGLMFLISVKEPLLQLVFRDQCSAVVKLVVLIKIYFHIAICEHSVNVSMYRLIKSLFFKYVVRIVIKRFVYLVIWLNSSIFSLYFCTYSKIILFFKKKSIFTKLCSCVVSECIPRCCKFLTLGGLT